MIDLLCGNPISSHYGDSQIMTSVVTNPGPAPQRSAPTVNTLIADNLAARPGTSKGGPGPVEDAEGFELPKIQRDKIKRRWAEQAMIPLFLSILLKPCLPLRRWRSRFQILRLRRPNQSFPAQTMPKTTQSPQSLEASLGVDGGGGGLAEVGGSLRAGRRRRPPLLSVMLPRETFTTLVRGGGGMDGVNLFSALFYL